MNDLRKLKQEMQKNSKALPRKIKPSNKDMVCEYIGEVTVGGVLHEVYLTDWKFGRGEYGHIIPEANKIYLSKHQNPHNLLVTLIHEMLHRILGEYQIYKLLSDSNLFQMEESIVETLDTPITNDLLLSETNFKMFRRILSGEFVEEK